VICCYGVVEGSLSPKAHCQKTISFHIRDRQCLEATRVTWCLSTLMGGYHSMDATFLGSQGDLIVGTFQPKDACQPTDIVKCFYPLFLPTVFTQRDGLASRARQSNFNPGAATRERGWTRVHIDCGSKTPTISIFRQIRRLRHQIPNRTRMADLKSDV